MIQLENEDETINYSKIASTSIPTSEEYSRIGAAYPSSEYSQIAASKETDYSEIVVNRNTEDHTDNQSLAERVNPILGNAH